MSEYVNKLLEINNNNPLQKSPHGAVGKDKSKNILLNLVRGDFGLAGTFWGWGVGGTGLLTCALIMFVSATGAESLIVPFLLVWFTYSSAVYVGVWRSDKSASFVSIISKLAVVVAFIIVSFITFYLTAVLTSPYPAH